MKKTAGSCFFGVISLVSQASYAFSSGSGSIVDPFSPEKLTNTFFMLMVVLSALILSLIFFKKILIKHKNSMGEIKVISGVSLGPKEKVVLIKIRDTFIAVGVSSSTINTLYAFKEENSQENHEEYSDSFVKKLTESLKLGE